MDIKVSSGFILIEPVKAKESTASGIYLPEKKGRIPNEALIVDMGDKINSKGEKMEVNYKKGDMIIYKKWEGFDFSKGGKKLKFIKHEDVLAVLK